jgi:natural product biosynthesis luciferase-like monooxygenase protein
LPLTTDALSRNDAANDPALLSTYVPVEIDLTQSWPDYVSTFTARQHDADTNGSFFVDICIRYPDRPSLASYDSWCRHIVLDWTSDATAHTASLSGSAVPGTSLITWSAAPSLTARADLERLARGFLAFIDDLASAPDRSLSAVSILDARERRLTLFEWNETDRPVPAACVHELIEAQVRRTPDVTAVIFRDRSFTYDALNQQANALALRLRELGVGPNQVVGVFVERSLEMVVAMLGILKAGAAYLPLDPAFPQERLAWMLEDTGAPVIVTQEALRDTLPRHRAQVVIVDLPQTPVTIADPPPAAAPADLAYVIFTSGSTGRPKGVMVEHRQAVNFFIGMDEYLGGRAPGTWLAVTSISFDISVLELFWTLARGFTVVVQEELVKAAGASGPEPATNERGMAFSLFYFSADASSDQGHRYRLLLEGARYADTHGFSGVWTPERHFHAFGGLYPNPAVTSAAVAAVTSRVRVRAGSVVLPLHNPIRVAEEWAVVDHLSGGRVELSFASGWHANDFALMPENYKNRRDVMLSGIETIRRLWSGASVPATNGHGEPIEIKVFPAPLQPTPPFWIAAAGSIDTFRLAGRIGAHLLTNLLGQKIADVATKIAAYRTAWREAGHEGEGAVALMLHTFVGPDLDAVRETVRRPLIDYLKTSTELVKQTRWEFPAFANPSGRQAPGGDVELTDEEIDAMMSHAFDRYFETSGLFGTPEVCLRRVNELKAIGVDEIACLLDFGIPTDTVLAHLPYLKDVLDRSQPRKHERTDYTIAAQIARHRITHLQSTPSLIRTILADEHGRDALARVTTLLVGGEPLPASLVKAILPLIKGELLNMYGPTETTVWSTVARITDADDITIGRPIANTQIYIADAAGQPLPIGAAGELLIGGLGVTRGYWQREDLTSERFVANACVPERGDRLYRTGDLARYRPDGRIECLGRIDYQVKVSGHRIELGEIEAAISTHPAVNQSVVVVRPDAAGEPRLVAYVVPKRATTAERGDVSRWQAVWDETYGGLGGTARALDATFDLSGWRDSYTGEPMAEADMREWVDATASRILELKPARVLEIGCGMGLLVHRVAPAVEHYAAVDFSPMAVARVTESVRARGLTNVTVRAAAADAVDQYADLGPVDLVVINSVAQYFPSAAYLTRVLQQAVTLVRPGGAVFIGDVRSLPLLAAFHLSIELAQAPANMATTELRQRVRERVEHDPELVLAPEYFEQLAADTPAITGVDLQLKRGRAHNEMTRFRYDAWLFVNAPAAISTDVAAVSTSVADLSPTLASAAGSVIVRGLVNPRLTRELAALRRLGAPDSPETVGELRHEIGSDAAAGVEPEELVAQAAGWIVDVRWAASGAPGEYDATFRRPGQPRGVPATTSATRTAAALAHEPPQDRGQLVQSLKQHLRQHLPPYMVPGVFVSLEVLPLTPNGKVDRKALPEPDRERQATTSSYVAPTNDFERVIAETWQEILALDRVGVHDNFFDIGANSLLMVQAHAALREKLARPISLVDLFRFPTVGTLAGFLSRAGEPAESAALTASEARAQARLDALSRRRQGRQAARPSESTSR